MNLFTKYITLLKSPNAFGKIIGNFVWFYTRTCKNPIVIAIFIYCTSADWASTVFCSPTIDTSRTERVSAN